MRTARTQTSFGRAYYEEVGYTGKIETSKPERTAAVLKRWSPQGGTVLNIGCGVAAISAILADVGYVSLAFDISEDAVEIARQKCGDRVELWQADALQYDLAQRKPDAIIATDFIEHVSPSDAEIIRAKAYDALPPGGIFLIESPVLSPLTILNHIFNKVFLAKKFKNAIDHTGDLAHHFWFSTSQWVNWMAEQFDVIDVDFLIYRGLHWPTPTRWRLALDRIDTKHRLTRHLATSVIVVGRKPENTPAQPS